VILGRPDFANGARSFGLLSFGIFALLAFLFGNTRRSTPGMALAAVRGSPVAAACVLGLPGTRLRLWTAAVATFVAALGGGLLAMSSGVALPTNYNSFLGLTWLAVVVTIGVRSSVGALIAGLAFTLFPGLVDTYLSGEWGNLPPLLFGLGAIGVAVNPGGSLEMTRQAIDRLGRRRFRPVIPSTPAAVEGLWTVKEPSAK
jgi:branched-chain amino acid transport system permease protein